MPLNTRIGQQSHWKPIFNGKKRRGQTLVSSVDMMNFYLEQEYERKRNALQQKTDE